MNGTLAAQSVVDAIALGSLYALVALGVALIFGILGLINFAHSELIMVGAFALLLLGDVPIYLRLLLMAVLVVVVALAMERVAFRPVRGASPATLLITSFALSYLLQNLAILILGPETRSGVVSDFFGESFDVGNVVVLNLDLITVIVTVGLLVALAVFLTRTRMGIQMRAAAEDFRTARLLGVRADRVIATAFAISGLLAAVAALVVTSQSGVVQANIGVNIVLLAFVATILGGMGSLGGAVLGGFLLGAVTVALQAYLPVELRPYRDAFVYGAVFLTLTFRPNGLIVTRAAKGRV